MALVVVNGKVIKLINVPVEKEDSTLGRAILNSMILGEERLNNE